MGFENCIKKGLIKRHKTKDRVLKSIEISKRFLESAKNNLNINEYEMCIIAGYNSLFHLCRALLFNKDYIEKSHYCLIEALNQLYKKDGKILRFLNAIDKIRLSRHEIQYRGEFADQKEAKYVLDLAKEVFKYIKEKIEYHNLE